MPQHSRHIVAVRSVRFRSIKHSKANESSEISLKRHRRRFVKVVDSCMHQSAWGAGQRNGDGQWSATATVGESRGVIELPRIPKSSTDQGPAPVTHLADINHSNVTALRRDEDTAGSIRRRKGKKWERREEEGEGGTGETEDAVAGQTRTAAESGRHLRPLSAPPAATALITNDGKPWIQ